ncbi:MAG: tetratricopeptide repeat protein [bacterium]
MKKAATRTTKTLFSLISFLVIIIIVFFSRSVLARVTASGLDKNPPGKKSGILSSPDKPNQAKEHFQKGVEYTQSNQVDLAIKEYRTALELDPNFIMAHVNLGMSHIQKKEFDAAVRELHKAIQINPKLTLAHLNLWWAYRQQGKYDEGIAELKKVIALDPNDTNAYLNLGNSYLSDKKMAPEAIQAYLDGLAKGNETAEIHQKIGKAYEINRQFDKAIEHFHLAIGTDRNNLYTYLFLYVTLEKSKRKLEAAETLRNGLAAFKTRSLLADSSYTDIAHLMECLLGTYSEKDLLSIKNPVIICQVHYYLGMSYFFQNKRKEAIQHLQQAIETQMNIISEYEYAKIELEQIQGQK